MAQAIFRRYVSDSTTSEQELQKRSGEPVELIGEPYYPDEVEDYRMIQVRFADGYEAIAFEDEITWQEEQ
jgi:hypothetical protein